MPHDVTEVEPDPGKAGDRQLVKAICRMVAREYSQMGQDPKMVEGRDAWTWYVSRTIGELRAEGTYTKMSQEYRDFLQLDGPGGVAFCEEWLSMSRAALVEGADLWLPKGSIY